MDYVTFFKKCFYFLLMPIIIPIALLMQLTYDWWAALYNERWVVFFILSPIYVPLALLMYFVFPFWSKLSE